MGFSGGEFGLIRKIREWAGRKKADQLAGIMPGILIGNETSDYDTGVVLGIGDDAACLTGPGADKKLLATVDMLVEGIHFNLTFITPRQLGHKSLAASLSDIAAMAGEPRYALVSLGLRAGLGDSFVKEFYEGFLGLASEYGVHLVGGDTVHSPAGLILDVVVLGESEKPLCRAGAQPGNLLAVTGSLGTAAAGLAWLLAGKHQHKNPATPQDLLSLYPEPHPDNNILGYGLDPARVTNGSSQHLLTALPQVIAAHLEPRPRLREARILSNLGAATAMMDLSDGLAGDIHHLAEESRVGAVIHAAKLPVTQATRAVASFLEQDFLKWALSGGEDYELLVALRPDKLPAAQQHLAVIGTPLTVIGQITPAGEGILIEEVPGHYRPLEPKGYDHLS